jgi:hypothetical protein
VRPVARVAGDHRALVDEIEAPAARRRADHLLEGSPLHARGDVEHRAGHGRGRDAVVLGDLVERQLRFVEPDPPAPLHATTRRRGHVHPAGGIGDKPPVGRRVEVAQYRPWAACQHCGKPASLAAQLGVPVRVHAAMQEEIPPGPHAEVDRRLGDAPRDELPASDDAVLPPDERREGTIVVALTVHVTVKAPRTPISPPRRPRADVSARTSGRRAAGK